MLISNPTAKFGEEIAEKYLIKLDYKIIEKTFEKVMGKLILS